MFVSLRPVIVIALSFLCLNCSDDVSGPDRDELDIPQPLGSDDATWELTFTDDFDRGVLDRTKWHVGWPWGRTADHVDEYIADENLKVEEGTLQIVSREEPKGGKRYTSGMVTTFDKFEQTYGFFEVRAQVARGMGLVSAFWLANEDTWPPELDVFEILGRDPTDVHMTHHFRNESGDATGHSGHWRGPDFSAGYHTYGLLWSEGEIVWYVDGVERKRVSQTTVIPDLPMYILLNVHVGGNDWWGWPDATTPWPTTMEVDYVRAWKR